MSDASNWSRLKHGAAEHRSYSRRRLCAMRWDAAPDPHWLSKCTSAVLPAGGPIALLTGDGSMPGARMQIFSGAGDLLSAWEWDFGRVRALGWTSAVELACVLEGGRVMLWSVRGQRSADFALAEHIGHQEVLQCELFSTGLILLTKSLQLYALLSFTQRTVIQLPDPRLATPPTAMAVLEKPENAASSSTSNTTPLAPATAEPTGSAAALAASCPSVLLATTSRTILHIDPYECQDQLLTSGPFLRLSASPNGKFVAAFSASGNLLVMSSDFSRHLSELSTHSNEPPRHLAWCGSDSLLLPWGSTLLMVGPYGDSVRFEYNHNPLLHAEIDGVRIITNDATELLHRVPEQTELIFTPGSLAPAARLVEACTAFNQGDARCDELLCSLEGEMASAVICCIHASRYEIDTDAQKDLLRSAAFGKAYAL